MSIGRDPAILGCEGLWIERVAVPANMIERTGKEFPMSSFESDPVEEVELTGVTADAAPSGSVTSFPEPRPWGPWATLGWSAVCVVVMVVIQFVGLIVFVVAEFALEHRVTFESLVANGNVVAVATLASTPAVVGLVAVLVRIRRCPIAEYLALVWPPARQLLSAIGGMAIVLIATDLTSYSLGRPIVPPVMVNIYRTAWLPGLLLALVVLAPAGEEVLFRGFLYKGLAASRAGPAVAIVVSAIGWALLHIQYDWYGVVSIGAVGLYLGFVRYKTGSLPVTMLLHAIGNAVATAELAIQVYWFK
jgi:membrane protease YdiL (CAAX protease family)